MHKNGKKNPYQLKFDISKGNLQCFIKKKSISVFQSQKNEKRRKPSRGKPKSTMKKIQAFHQQKFISSIIKNAMEQDFSDPKQVTDMLNKINIYGNEQVNDNNNQEGVNQSPIQDEDILKSFEIFKEPAKSSTPQMKSYEIVTQSENNQIKKYQQSKQGINAKEFDLSFGKDHQWNNFSTQIGTDRSRKSDVIETYPSLLPNQYYLPINSQSQYLTESNMFLGLTKQQKQRKSTPIRENEQFKIQLDKLQFDGRTTVMIRHIPNKYTQQMLIDQINQNHRLKYNFFYLPVDSYNPCNVGYAFINFIDAKFISKFYTQFHGKRWTKFNSQKICQLAYARIQGSTALINHFQNSNIMKAGDKRLRPYILFGQTANSGSKQMK